MSAWQERKVTVVHGLGDKRIDTGEEFETCALGSFWNMPPSNKPKHKALAFLPSTYHEFDAREHKAQQEHGSFVALVGDVDKGCHGIERVEGAVKQLVGDSAWLIYSTAKACPENLRWRVVLPLEQPVDFPDWRDAQEALCDFMSGQGIEMDCVTKRAGQIAYLPNVPATHEDTGQALRDEEGWPLYFTRASSGTDAPGLRLDTGLVADAIADLKRRRAEDEQLREQMRAKAAPRRANRPASDGDSLIDAFNRANPLPDILKRYRYEQSPRDDLDWMSPNQKSGSYATRIMGDKWFSLSGSDSSEGVGTRCDAGCYGDAFDLFVHYEHGGNRNAALAELRRERDGESGRKASPDANGQRYSNDPGYSDLPDGHADDDLRIEPAEPAAPEAAKSDDAPGPLPGQCGPEEWETCSAPERRFIIPGWIARGSAGLLSGEDGVGKSLLGQQLATCTAAGVDFLGLSVERVRSLYISCEDDKGELQRRQEAINAALGIDMAATKGWLRCSSLKGELGNELAFTNEGLLEPSRRFTQIRQLALEFGANLIVLDNAAHLFTGNENDRHDVATFLGLLERLSIEIDGAVILLAHPNKQLSQGNRQGNEYSGSTAWSAHVRNRLFLDWERGDTPNPDGRTLRRSKSNYSRAGEEIGFVWHEWAFVRLDDLPPSVAEQIQAVARAGAANDMFLRCLEKTLEQKENVSHAPTAGNYAPKTFAAMAMAKGFPKSEFESAMRRLLDMGVIRPNEPVFQYPNRSWAKGLVIVPEAAQNLAQNLLKTMHNGCTTADPDTAENRELDCTTARTTECLGTTYHTGAALEAAAPGDELDWSDGVEVGDD